MKTLLSLGININVILILIASFSEAGKPFQEVRTVATSSPGAVPADTDQVTLLDDTSARYIMESCGLAYLMLTLGENKYLPHDNRTDAFLSAGPGAGNTMTGVIGFIRLQTELIARKGIKGAVQPYTKVTILISRKEVGSDKNTAPELGGTYEEKLAKLKILLSKLETLMKSNNFDYVLIEEPEDIAKLAAFHQQLDEIKLKDSTIAIGMDILVGFGKLGEMTADKARKSLQFTKELHVKKVPTFLHDGRSCGHNSDNEVYKIEGGLTYGVYTATVKEKDPGQGLILTDKTKDAALSNLEEPNVHKFGVDTKKDVPIRVTLVKALVKSNEIFVKALTDISETLDKAFDSVYVQDLGVYYRK